MGNRVALTDNTRLTLSTHDSRSKVDDNRTIQQPNDIFANVAHSERTPCVAVKLPQPTGPHKGRVARMSFQSSPPMLAFNPLAPPLAARVDAWYGQRCEKDHAQGARLLFEALHQDPINCDLLESSALCAAKRHLDARGAMEVTRTILSLSRDNVIRLEGIWAGQPSNEIAFRLRKFVDAVSPDKRQAVIERVCSKAHVKSIDSDPFQLKHVPVHHPNAPVPGMPTDWPAIFAALTMVEAPPSPRQPLSKAEALGKLFAANRHTMWLMNNSAAALDFQCVYKDGSSQTKSLKEGESLDVEENLTDIQVLTPKAFLMLQSSSGSVSMGAGDEMPLLGVPDGWAQESRSFIEQQKSKAENTAVVPPYMHFIWLGNALPGAHHQGLQTFLDLNPDHHCILWTDLSREQLHSDPNLQTMRNFCSGKLNVINVQEALGPHIHAAGLHAPLVQQLLHRQYGAASDILRVIILEAMGGTYADTDRVCCQPLAGLRRHELVHWGDENSGGVIGNDFLMAQPGHPFMQDMLNTMRQRLHGPSDSLVGLRFRTGFTLEEAQVLYSTGPDMLDTTVFAWKEKFARTPNSRFRIPTRVIQDSPLGVSYLTPGMLWGGARSKNIKMAADRNETRESRFKRLVTCLLDDFKTFGSPNLESVRYQRYFEQDKNLQKDVLDEVTRLLTA